MNTRKKNLLLSIGIILLASMPFILSACQDNSDQNNSETSSNGDDQEVSGKNNGEDTNRTVNNPDMEVTLLGTGGPQLFPDRAGYSTLVEAGDQKLLFDTGRGVMQRLYESKKDISDVTNVFYTHLHNDHTEGLPPLWMEGWLMHDRDEQMNVWGPEGTQHMIDGMRDMSKFNVDNRPDEQHDAEDLEVNVDEFEGEEEVYDQDGVTVTAFPVEHGDGNPAFGYRIDYKDRSVVLSGDTSYHDNVVEYGEGADLIVHNVVALSDEILDEKPEVKATLDKLTPPEDAAKVFEKAEPRMAIYSHMVVNDIPLKDMEDHIMESTREAGYDGPLEVGKDRTVIKIGDDIDVSSPVSKEGLGIEGN